MYVRYKDIYLYAYIYLRTYVCACNINATVKSFGSCTKRRVDALCLEQKARTLLMATHVHVICIVDVLLTSEIAWMYNKSISLLLHSGYSHCTFSVLFHYDRPVQFDRGIHNENCAPRQQLGMQKSAENRSVHTHTYNNHIDKRHLSRNIHTVQDRCVVVVL